MPTLPHIPDLISTERLELRAPELGHVAELTRAVRESLPELQVYMPWATDDYDEAGCEASMRNAIADFVTKRDLRYHIFEKVTGRLIGSTGFHRIRWEVPRLEIGYWLASSRTGNGFTTEAAAALTRVAFEQLGANRVEICCDDRNLASAAVAVKCGYSLDAVLHNNSRGVDGTLRHTRVYSRTSGG